MPIPAPYAELAVALRERLAVIADRAFYDRDPAAHLEKLRTVSEKITRLGAALPRPIPGDFAHYLQRASYQKALDWIEAQQG
jgi:hypothetical protein